MLHRAAQRGESNLGVEFFRNFLTFNKGFLSTTNNRLFSLANVPVMGNNLKHHPVITTIPIHGISLGQMPDRRIFDYVKIEVIPN